jgi:signal peptidase I
MLGGPTTYLIISGVSMEPTFFDGDLVLVGRRAQYDVGDVIAYEIDDYYLTERYVIHRIVGKTPNGEFLTQGDNRDDIDSWVPTSEQIIGRSFIQVPRVGRVVAFLQEEPWRLALAAGVAIILSVIPIGVSSNLPDRRQRRRQRLEQRRKQRMSW